MRVRDYWKGIPVEIALPLPPRESARRIGAHVGWRLLSYLPFPTRKPVFGSIHGNRLVLEFAGPSFLHQIRPRLTAQLVADADGARLEGKFGAPPGAAMLLLVFQAVSLFFLFMVVRDIIAGEGLVLLLGVAISLGFSLLPALMMMWQADQADIELAGIVAAVRASFDQEA